MAVPLWIFGLDCFDYHFNVINSIALSVAARTKQYGAFRAIGLSTHPASRMVIAEAATYAVSGCIIGTLLG